MDRLVEDPAEQFRFFEAFTRDGWVKARAKELPSGSRVLDAGAGASKYRPYFGHCRYQTQDFCQYEGELVKYREPIDYVCDITRIPEPDGTFDAILCTEVLEHVPDPVLVLREFSRLVRPGGRLWLTAPLISAIHMAPYHYFGGLTGHWYRHWLPKHRFNIESITPVGGPGRSCAVYAEVFCAEWSKAEKRASLARRFMSVPFRLAAKAVSNGLLRNILPRMDAWLGAETVCSGYLVAAVRE